MSNDARGAVVWMARLVTRLPMKIALTARISSTKYCPGNRREKISVTTVPRNTAHTAAMTTLANAVLFNVTKGAA
jgi:hypothetical protein